MPFSAQCPQSPLIAPAMWSIPQLTSDTPGEDYVGGSWTISPAVNGSTSGNNLTNVPAGNYTLTFDLVYTDANGDLVSQDIVCQVEVLEAVFGCPTDDVTEGTPVVIDSGHIGATSYTYSVNGQPVTGSNGSVVVNEPPGLVTVEITCVTSANSTDSCCADCEDPCPCAQSTVASIQEYGNGSIHPYSTLPFLDAGETLANLSYTAGGQTSQVIDIDTGASLGWPGVAYAAAWSCVEPGVIWGATGGNTIIKRNVVTGVTEQPVKYTAPVGTTNIQFGEGQGVVQGCDRCLAIDRITNGVEILETLDLTTTPATVIGTMPASPIFKWVRFNKDCTKVLVYEVENPTNSTVGDRFLTIYDPDFTNPQSLIPTGHSDFICMPNGDEYIYSVGGTNQDAQLVANDGSGLTIGTVKSLPFDYTSGHVSALSSVNCPGTMLWSPSLSLANGDPQEGPMTLYQFDDNFNVVWSLPIPFNHGPMDAYENKPKASISRCGKYISVSADQGNGTREFLVTLDNTNCPTSTAEPVTETFSCSFTVIDPKNGAECDLSLVTITKISQTATEGTFVVFNGSGSSIIVDGVTIAAGATSAPMTGTFNPVVVNGVTVGKYCPDIACVE